MPSAAIGRTPPSENWPSALTRTVEAGRQLEDTFDEVSVAVLLNFCTDSGGFVIR